MRDDFAELRAALFVEKRMAGQIGKVKIAFEVIDRALPGDLRTLLHREAVERGATPEQRLHARRQVGFEPQALFFSVSPVLKRVHPFPLKPVVLTARYFTHGARIARNKLRLCRSVARARQTGFGME